MKKILILGLYLLASLLSAEPLHDAVRGGDAETTRKLIKSGAYIEAKDRWGKTPLHLAIHGGDPKVIRMLLAAGANIEATNHEGLTPLYLAANYNKEKMTIVLLESGANTEATSNEGITPLGRAAYWTDWGIDKVVRALCIWGANPTNIEAQTLVSQRIISRYQGQQPTAEIEYLRELYKKHGTTKAVRTAIVTLKEYQGKKVGPKIRHRLLYWLGDEVEEIEQ